MSHGGPAGGAPGADPWAAATSAAATLATRTGRPSHRLAIVLGSGWAPAADLLGPLVAEVPFADLGVPAAGVPGHTGAVRSIDVSGAPVLCMLGRVHAYEGHDLSSVVHAVRTAAAAGCSRVVLTNAAGGLDPAHRVGQAVLISDHLNLTGRSPLTGPAPPEPWPPRFVDLTDCYGADLRASVQGALVAAGGDRLAEGVYAGLPGPHYETPAEIRMLATLGADLVGMSTVHEAIAARHAGMGVLGMSLVTNAAAGVTGEVLDHAEVVAAGRAATGALGELLGTAVAALLRLP